MIPDFSPYPVFYLPEPENLNHMEWPEGSRSTLVLWEDRPAQRAELAAFARTILETLPVRLEEEVLLLPLTAGQPVALQLMMQKLGVRRIIVFGISPAILGMAIQPKEYDLFRMGMREYLWAHDLQAIREERQAGGRTMSAPLWKSLQQMFDAT